MTGVALASLPTSSSICMIFFILACIVSVYPAVRSPGDIPSTTPLACVPQLRVAVPTRRACSTRQADGQCGPLDPPHPADSLLCPNIQTSPDAQASSRYSRQGTACQIKPQKNNSRATSSTACLLSAASCGLASGGADAVVKRCNAGQSSTDDA